MQCFIDQLVALLKVKSIITIVIIFGVTYGFITGMIQSEVYAAFASSIITYYFTRTNDDKVM